MAFASLAVAVRLTNAFSVHSLRYATVKGRQSPPITMAIDSLDPACLAHRPFSQTNDPPLQNWVVCRWSVRDTFTWTRLTTNWVPVHDKI